MAPQALWLTATILEILGILFIGDDVITARANTKAAASSRITEDGTGDRAGVSVALNRNPWKSVVGVGLLLAGLALALAAS